jgi:GNAT superfamily N-acetyltransferase
MEATGADECLVSDLLLLPYLRYTPETVWVADHGGQVVGYLTGCLDTVRLDRLRPWILAPRLFRHLVLRRRLVQPPTRALLRYGLQSRFVHREFQREATPWPAHLHLNIAPAHQGTGAGGRLMRHFLQKAKNAGSAGIHVTTSSPHGPSFFEHYGFQPVLERKTPALFGRPPQPWLLMAVSL